VPVGVHPTVDFAKILPLFNDIRSLFRHFICPSVLPFQLPELWLGGLKILVTNTVKIHIQEINNS
uniref:hypothetical protein n=1 Tax=Stenotrophomonas maltophilia TaxID=40324 RepID=UPI0019537F05